MGQNNSIFSGGIGAGGANALTEEGVTNNSVFGGGTGGDGIVQELDYFAGGTYEALPVELIRFNVICSAKGLSVEWTTATEVNSERFVLYRKQALEAPFEALVNVSAAGFSVAAKEYQYLDNCTECGEVFYYLKMVDFDGSSERSDIIQVNCGSSKETASNSQSLLWTEQNAEAMLEHLKKLGTNYLVGVDGRIWPLQTVSLWQLPDGFFMAHTSAGNSFKVVVQSP